MATRVQFEDGRLLSTADYVDEQNYHRTRMNDHLVTEHTWGIATGLEVTDSGSALAVLPGRAVDGYGRELVLTSARVLDLRPFELRRIESVDVWISYDETTEPSGNEQLDRVREGARVHLDQSAGGDPRTPPGVTDPTNAPASWRGRPVPPKVPWPVYLGTVIRDLSKPDEPVKIELTGRPYIGVVADALHRTPADGESPDPTSRWMWIDNGEVTLSAGPFDGVKNTDFRIAKDGASLNGLLDVDGDVRVHDEAPVVVGAGAIGGRRRIGRRHGQPQPPLPRAQRLGSGGLDGMVVLGDRGRAGGQRFRRLLHLHEAHAAIGRDRQLFVVAEARHVRVMGVGDVDDHRALLRLARDAIDFDVDEVLAHLRPPASRRR